MFASSSSRGLSPSLFTASTSAPACKSVSAIFILSRLSALYRRTSPSIVSSMASSFLFNAKLNAVFPSRSTALISACAPKRKLTTSGCANAEAACKGVHPASLLRFRFAPAPANSRTASTRPLAAALNIGVRPQLHLSSMRASACIKIEMTST